MPSKRPQVDPTEMWDLILLPDKPFHVNSYIPPVNAVLTFHTKYPLQTFTDRGKQGNLTLLWDMAVKFLLPQPLQPLKPSLKMHWWIIKADTKAILSPLSLLVRIARVTHNVPRVPGWHSVLPVLLQHSIPHKLCGQQSKHWRPFPSPTTQPASLGQSSLAQR